MTGRDAQNEALFSEIHRLATSCLDGDATAATLERLEVLIRDPDVLDIYMEYLNDSISLRQIVSTSAESEVDPVALLADIEIDDSVDPSACLPAQVPSSPHAFLTTLHGTVGYFSSGWPVAYLVAAVILGLGLLVGGVTHVSQPGQVAHKVVPFPSPHSPLHPVVGQITGMVDCQWSEVGWVERSEPHQGTRISLGDSFALTSGLLEITYDNGARVILQGPCTYEVESAAGGFLSVGKLTATVEKRAEGGGRRAENADAQPSPFRLPPSALFAVRTPTATVTDLGTEFGVEVDKQGSTVSRVFRGVVEVRAVAEDGKPHGEGTLLRDNESVQVGRNGGAPTIVARSAATAGHFVREMPKNAFRTLDLVDITAGGDGLSGRRDHGIDPTNGRPTDTNAGYMTGDGKYHRVEGIPFVDGVFIPHGGTEPVQIDSAGHTFSEFGNANNLTANHVWAGGVIPTNPPYAISTRIKGVDYARRGRGLLFLHSNKGITFDLDAIRKANPEHKLLRFHATAGNSEHISEDNTTEYGDLWVFVDGQMRFKRQKMNYHSGAIPIEVAIGDKDRFLTLAATDGGRPIEYNWIIIGSPRLDMQFVIPKGPEGIDRNASSQSP